jgi:hypothetical protein
MQAIRISVGAIENGTYVVPECIVRITTGKAAIEII